MNTMRAIRITQDHLVEVIERLEQAIGAMRVVALEVAPADRQEVSPALRVPVDRWANAGTAARAAVVPGVAFWQTQEIEVCEPLIEASVEALKGFVR